MFILTLFTWQSFTPTLQNSDPLYLKMEDNSEKQYLTKDTQNNVLNNVHPYIVCHLDPKRSLGPDIKTIFHIYLKTITNF